MIAVGKCTFEFRNTLYDLSVHAYFLVCPDKHITILMTMDIGTQWGDLDLGVNFKYWTDSNSVVV